MTEQKKSVKKTTVTRRQFVVGAAAAAFMIVPRHVLGGKAGPAPSEKLNLGSIGVGGMQGVNDVGSVSSENIYALCDVDENHLNKTAARYPKAKLYRDFREMLDKEQKNLNGVTITIPDFMHATASLWAMERGIAVHCQKPLTATVWEARLLANAARKYKVATQMGNQGYSSRGDAHRLRIYLERRNRRRHRGAFVERRRLLARHHASGRPPSRFPPRSTGTSGRDAPRSTPTARRSIRSTGAGSWIMAP